MQDTIRSDFLEPTIAAANTTANTFIDGSWASIDVSHTPTEIQLTAVIKFSVTNGTGVTKIFDLRFTWTEDATVQNTRMKAIWAAFTAGLTAMEGASSYTTVVSVAVNIVLRITYS
jgi:hypothetical protein